MEKENAIPEFAYNFELCENRRLTARVVILGNVIKRWMEATPHKLLAHFSCGIERCPCCLCELSRRALEDIG